MPKVRAIPTCHLFSPILRPHFDTDKEAGELSSLSIGIFNRRLTQRDDDVAARPGVRRVTIPSAEIGTPKDLVGPT